MRKVIHQWAEPKEKSDVYDFLVSLVSLDLCGPNVGDRGSLNGLN